ncbi:hypothetical protein AGABI2DRAFT_209008 [Agaricus bisporus var. bisporus H97]|uniref:hypothetical protein n=1 Tax=Agaricus bisporus var. bisporus (strain H97 / ATCC MYA-4626 / FGSC 10389) TaxID=936046 RepID=UPI00029F4F1F|nr:hypothetical protein AGABI2DRAFT_209008 [Agaricus bisporus var. bisporus H97]EKV44663.1 hypothetical protein AGABI2DRAFT_209008 [Agaricus bisporus var. bisporus H97]
MITYSQFRSRNFKSFTSHFFNSHILNLSKGASQTEVHERYRTLSLVFHPDKQQDAQAKEVAARNFLEIQKAYQVLSDPFLRYAQSPLCDAGLALKWPETMRSKTIQEVRDHLSRMKGELLRHQQSAILLPKGTLECVVDATSLFQNAERHGSILGRAASVRFNDYTLRHDVQKKINDKTTIRFGAQVKDRVHRLDISGTVRHQFSPRLSTSALLHFGFPFQVNLESSYQDDSNSLVVKAFGALGAPLLFPPGLNIHSTRNLFKRRNKQASVNLHVGRHPHVYLRLTSITPFGLDAHSTRYTEEDFISASGSISGLELGTTFTSYGIDLEQRDPKLVAEGGVNLLELGTTLKTGFTMGIVGVKWFLSAVWLIPSTSSEISTTTSIGPPGIFFVLQVTRLEQQITLPIYLSAEANVFLTLCTTVLPAVTGLLLYRFVVMPRRKAKKIAHLRAARKALEESDERRERNAVEGLLKDLARKHDQVEKSKQGLVIIQASYGGREKEEGAPDLTLDVTIPIQSLIRNSQLYIPSGEEAKLNIQGFFDPAPLVSKVLRIRYLFREQMHYAEIPDYQPTVLPLLEHRVDGQ